MYQQDYFHTCIQLNFQILQQNRSFREFSLQQSLKRQHANGVLVQDSENFLRYIRGDIKRYYRCVVRRVEKWPIRPVLWMVEFFMARTIFNDPVHFYRPFIGHRRVRLIYYLRLARNFEQLLSTAALPRVTWPARGVFYSSGYSSYILRSFSWEINDRDENSEPINISMTLNGFSCSDLL